MEYLKQELNEADAEITYESGINNNPTQYLSAQDKSRPYLG